MKKLNLSNENSIESLAKNSLESLRLYGCPSIYGGCYRDLKIGFENSYVSNNDLINARVNAIKVKANSALQSLSLYGCPSIYGGSQSDIDIGLKNKVITPDDIQLALMNTKTYQFDSFEDDNTLDLSQQHNERLRINDKLSLIGGLVEKLSDENSNKASSIPQAEFNHFNII